MDFSGSKQYARAVSRGKLVVPQTGTEDNTSMKKDSAVNIRRCPWIQRAWFPMMVTALILALYLFSDPQFSSAGDANIAELLADGSRVLPGYINLTWPLVWVLHPLTHAVPQVCWWTIFSIVMMFGSLLTILLSLRKMVSGWRGSLLIVLTAGFLWADILAGPINFTINTALTASAGFLLLSGISQQNRHAGRMIHIFFGIILLGIAGSLRWLELFLCLPFFLLSLLLCIAAPGGRISLKRFRRQSDLDRTAELVRRKDSDCAETSGGLRFTNRVVLSAAVLVVLMTVGTWGAGKLTQKLDPWYAENYAGNELLGDISDYADRYPSYEQNADAYQQTGITSSWISMVMNSANSDLNHFSSSEMTKMLAFRGETQMSLSQYCALLASYPAVWLVCLGIIGAAVWMFGLRSCLLPLLGEAGGFLAAGVFFVRQGRIAWRVTGGMLFAALAGFLVASAAGGVIDRRRKVNEPLVKVAALIILVLLIVPSVTYKVPRAEVTDPVIDSDYRYMSSHPENCYFVDNQYYMGHSIWTGFDQKKYSNIVPDISNFIIGFRKQLADRGITDIVSDMLVRGDILMNYGDTWYGYLKDYYDPDITITIMGENPETGTAYIAYHRPIENDSPISEETAVVSAPSLYLEAASFSDQQYRVLHVTASMENVAAGAGVTDYALEIEDKASGRTFTYPMTEKNGMLAVRAVWPEDTWAYDTSKVSIIGRKEDGILVQLLDLTGQPISFETSKK